MTAFKYNVKVNSPFADITDAALGAAAGDAWGDAEMGKAVKMGVLNNYVYCVEDDEIEGFVAAIEPTTVNDDFTFGAVQKNKRMLAIVGANEAGTFAIDDLAIADAQIVKGTAGIAQVKKGVAASQSGTTPFAYTERTPNTHLWRCIRIVSGTGVTGDTILLERV